MTRVIHTGDTHIGYQQYNSPERRRDFLSAFRSVAEDAIDADVDAVIHAGDLFHDRRPNLVDLQGTVEILRDLADADVPFLAVVGNHEGKRDAQWLDLFSDLGLATRLGAEPYVLEDVAVYGLDFVPRSRRESLEYAFDPAPDEADHAALVSHGLFEPFPHADWDTEHLLTASTVDFDSVLLGDNHHPDTAELEGTWLTYCGSTERASASEREDRGYNLVEFEPGEEPAIRRRGIEATREFVFVDVELAEGEGVDRVQERVRQHDLEDAVVIVTVEGEGKPITPAAVEELALDRGALVARVNDRRELPDEDADVSVSFANPDDAVRERVRELGLSDAARELDRTVRNDDLADANVRERVERRVRELIEDDDTAFEPAPDREPDDADATTVADREGGGDSDLEVSDAAEPASAADGDASDDAGDTSAGEDPNEDVATGTNVDAEAESSDDAETDPEDGPDSGSTRSSDGEYASLGDFE